jgi:MFS family permease
VRIGSSPWLNRNVVAMSATSLLSDASHEAATSVLPGFLAVLGLPPLALGVIEGVSDATSSFVKLGSGWIGDRTGNRWGLAVIGYTMTGLMPFFLAIAGTWPVVLGAKLLGWLGKGIRGPVRDAMLAASVAPAVRGRAFGFHRAGDTIGAVVGPALGVAVLASFATSTAEPVAAFRTVFLLALVPGILAAVTFAMFVRDPSTGGTAIGGFLGALGGLPRAFRRYLVGVGIFGIGDFAPSLLILAATILLTPSQGIVAAGATAGLLYVLRNGVYALASYPVGALSDRTGRPVLLLAMGYLLGTAVAAGTALAFVVSIDQPLYLAVLFLGSGLLAAFQDTLEAVSTAELAGDAARGTSFGLLGTVNGVGDLVASAGVGALWTVASPGAAFGAAAVAMGLGAVLVARLAFRDAAR